MIKPNNNNEKYILIFPNEFGRKQTIRYMQYLYSDTEGTDGIPNWEIYDYGCGVCALASILSSQGYMVDPIEVAKLILLDDEGNSLDFYTNKEKGRLGLTTLSFIYALQRLEQKYGYSTKSEIIKYSTSNSNLMKEKFTEMIRDGYMALILVAPKRKENHPRTFSEYSHHLAVTGVDNRNNEFYVCNPNEKGDEQIDITYPYEVLIDNIGNSQFLMIKRQELSKSLK